MDLFNIKMNKMISISIIMLGILPLLAISVLATTQKIYPSEDAYVDEYQSGTNFNTDNLVAGHHDYQGTPKGKQRSFLKFDLSSISGTVTDAKLSIDPIGGPVGTPNLQLYYVSSDSWSENSITWNNAPNYGSFIDSELVTSGDRIEFNVNSVIDEQDSVLSIMIKSQQEDGGDYHVLFGSSEFEAGGGGSEDEFYWPYLEIEYDGSGCNTVADSDCDNCVSLIEYNDFKYGYKNGLLPSVTLVEYNDIKYGYKNGVISC